MTFLQELQRVLRQVPDDLGGALDLAVPHIYGLPHREGVASDLRAATL